MFINKSLRTALILSSSIATLLLAGCASAPKPVVVEEPKYQTVWPLPPEQAVIRYVGQLREFDLDEGKQKTRFKDILGGEEAPSILRFHRPFGVHADKNGQVYIGDIQQGLFVVGPNGRFKGQWGTEGNSAIASASFITSDSAGNVYVCDTNAQRIMVFAPDGDFQFAFGGKEILEHPTSMAIDESTGQIFVIDGKRPGKIKVFDMQGTMQNEFGEFFFPTAIDIGVDGNLYVLDAMNFRVVKVNRQGETLLKFGGLGKNLGQFSRPKGLAIDSAGTIYVTDAAFNVVQMFSSDGELLMYFGTSGVVPGAFQMPAHIHIDANNKIYVADQYNRRIQIFEFLGVPDLPPEAEKDRK